jgi:hypothetical protein
MGVACLPPNSPRWRQQLTDQRILLDEIDGDRVHRDRQLLHARVIEVLTQHQFELVPSILV